MYRKYFLGKTILKTVKEIYMKFENSKTIENLKDAFMRECSAAIKYGFFAEQAKQDGFEQIYNVFNQFAENEKAHAKVWFKLFRGIGATEDNLKDSAELELFEKNELYADFASVAEKEGFSDIAELFRGAAAIEGQHAERFNCLYNKVSNGEFFSSPNEVVWQCGNCGHTHKGLNPPEKCPVCSHPKAYFSIMPEGN